MMVRSNMAMSSKLPPLLPRIRSVQLLREKARSGSHRSTHPLPPLQTLTQVSPRRIGHLEHVMCVTYTVHALHCTRYRPSLKLHVGLVIWHNMYVMSITHVQYTRFTVHGILWTLARVNCGINGHLVCNVHYIHYVQHTVKALTCIG